ncbi:hypothetical protein CGCF413_v003699 [Colletotrichum fructicola]|nr:hypothetical protein CFRS1_v009657 [Colletotrichum fructicola]KAF5509432.1 hypothetical protein CGCF413_v003699 [Colletotrichum fructicola]
MQNVSTLAPTSGTRPRAVYIIRRVHGCTSRQGRKAGLNILPDSAVLVFSCADNDNGMLWLIATGRSQQSPVWKRSEVSAKKDHPNLKQLGECFFSNAWIDRLAQRVIRSLEIENPDISAQQLEDQFCLRLVAFLLGTHIEADPSSRRDLRAALKNNHAHGPAVCTRISATLDHSWEPGTTPEDNEDDESDVSDLDSIVSQFDRESDNDYDPDDDSEDALSDDSSESESYESCLETMSDLDWDEYSDKSDDDDDEDDENDSLALFHASCCQSNYQRVHAIFMIWDFPGFIRLPYSPYTVEQEMEDPMDSFKAYNYDVEKFTIPSHNSTMGLLERIRKYRKSLVSGNPETLLILWYNGHGNIEGDRNDLVLCG